MDPAGHSFIGWYRLRPVTLFGCGRATPYSPECSSNWQAFWDECIERDVLVGELFDGDVSPRADEALDGGSHVPDVDVHTGHNSPCLEPECDELTSRAVAAVDEL